MPRPGLRCVVGWGPRPRRLRSARRAESRRFRSLRRAAVTAAVAFPLSARRCPPLASFARRRRRRRRRRPARSPATRRFRRLLGASNPPPRATAASTPAARDADRLLLRRLPAPTERTRRGGDTPHSWRPRGRASCLEVQRVGARSILSSTLVAMARTIRSAQSISESPVSASWSASAGVELLVAKRARTTYADEKGEHAETSRRAVARASRKMSGAADAGVCAPARSTSVLLRAVAVRGRRVARRRAGDRLLDLVPAESVDRRCFRSIAPFARR